MGGSAQQPNQSRSSGGAGVYGTYGPPGSSGSMAAGDGALKQAAVTSDVGGDNQTANRPTDDHQSNSSTDARNATKSRATGGAGITGSYGPVSDRDQKAMNDASAADGRQPVKGNSVAAGSSHGSMQSNPAREAQNDQHAQGEGCPGHLVSNVSGGDVEQSAQSTFAAVGHDSSKDASASAKHENNPEVSKAKQDNFNAVGQGASRSKL
eukprot:jgi/Chrzof1/5034/Cz15g09090.t1